MVLASTDLGRRWNNPLVTSCLMDCLHNCCSLRLLQNDLGYIGCSTSWSLGLGISSWLQCSWDLDQKVRTEIADLLSPDRSEAHLFHQIILAVAVDYLEIGFRCWKCYSILAIHHLLGMHWDYREQLGSVGPIVNHHHPFRALRWRIWIYSSFLTSICQRQEWAWRRCCSHP